MIQKDVNSLTMRQVAIYDKIFFESITCIHSSSDINLKWIPNNCPNIFSFSHTFFDNLQMDWSFKRVPGRNKIYAKQLNIMRA